MLSEEKVRWRAEKWVSLGKDRGRQEGGECGGSGSGRNDAGCNIENRPKDG